MAFCKRLLDETGVAHLDNPSHIVPVMVCDPVLCKQISDVLIDRYGIYVVDEANLETHGVAGVDAPRGDGLLHLGPHLFDDAGLDLGVELRMRRVLVGEQLAQQAFERAPKLGAHRRAR